MTKMPTARNSRNQTTGRYSQTKARQTKLKQQTKQNRLSTENIKPTKTNIQKKAAAK